MSEMTQAPGFYCRRLGDVVATAINDGVVDLPLGAMRGIEPEAALGLLQDAFRAPSPRSSVMCWIWQRMTA